MPTQRKGIFERIRDSIRGSTAKVELATPKSTEPTVKWYSKLLPLIKGLPGLFSSSKSTLEKSTEQPLQRKNTPEQKEANQRGQRFSVNERMERRKTKENAETIKTVVTQGIKFDNTPSISMEKFTETFSHPHSQTSAGFPYSSVAARAQAGPPSDQKAAGTAVKGLPEKQARDLDNEGFEKGLEDSTLPKPPAPPSGPSGPSSPSSP